MFHIYTDVVVVSEAWDVHPDRDPGLTSSQVVILDASIGPVGLERYESLEDGGIGILVGTGGLVWDVRRDGSMWDFVVRVAILAERKMDDDDDDDLESVVYRLCKLR